MHPPASPGHRQVRILYAAQTSVAPPTFVFFTNVATEFHFSYERFLVNRLRESFGLEGSPIRIQVQAAGVGQRSGLGTRGSAGSRGLARAGLGDWAGVINALGRKSHAGPTFRSGASPNANDATKTFGGRAH